MSGYREILDQTASRMNFITSDMISKIWPANLRQKAEKYFRVRNIINEINIDTRFSQMSLLEILDKCIQEPLLKNYILWACLSDQYAQKIITRAQTESPQISYNDLRYYLGMAARAAQKRDYLDAESYLGLADEALKTKLTMEGRYYLAMYRMYLSYIAKDNKQATKIGQDFIDIQRDGKNLRRERIKRHWAWMHSVVDADMDNNNE